MKNFVSQQQQTIQYNGDIFENSKTKNQIYIITHSSTNSKTQDNQLLNNWFREFDEIQDFSDEDEIEEKGTDKGNQAQKYKQEKQIKPLQIKQKKTKSI